MASPKTSGGKRTRKKRPRKAAPRKSAATKEKLAAEAPENGIEVTEHYVKRGDRVVPIVHPGSVPPIPDLPEAAAHIRRTPRPRNPENKLPDHPAQIPTNPSAPPELKTYAEQAGAARHDELQQESVRKMRRVDSEKTAKDGSPEANLSNPLVAMCPEELREPQPADFRPSEQLRQFVDSFCNAPGTTQGAALSRRVKYDVKDQPSIPIADAEIAGLEPVFLLGRQIESSPTKRYCGYDCPNVDTYFDAEAKVRQILESWDAGKEAIYRKTTFDVERKVLDDTDKKGRPVKTKPVIDKFRYRQSLYIFRPLDDAGQICIVVV